jgi:hypothetical protein
LKRQKSNLKAADFIDIMLRRITTQRKTIASILQQMKSNSEWKQLLEISFLTDEMKEKYLELLESRVKMFNNTPQNAMIVNYSLFVFNYESFYLLETTFQYRVYMILMA